MNLWVICGKELDEGVKLLRSVVILDEIWDQEKKLVKKKRKQQSFISFEHRLEPTGRFLAFEIAHQLDDIVHVVETFQLALIVDDLHGLFDDLVNKIPVKSSGNWSLWTGIKTHLTATTSQLTHAADITLVTYIIEELHQGVGGQFAIVLDDLVIGEDVNTLHLIQAWWESGVFMIARVVIHA